MGPNEGILLLVVGFLCAAIPLVVACLYYEKEWTDAQKQIHRQMGVLDKAADTVKELAAMNDQARALVGEADAYCKKAFAGWKASHERAEYLESQLRAYGGSSKNKGMN